MARPKATEQRLFTPAELQVMQVLWQIEQGSVADVQSRLNEEKRDYAYTTVSTILRVLEKKGAVRPEKRGRGHIYIPEIRKDDYQSTATQELVKDLFSGQATLLVKNLLGRSQLSSDEINELKKNDRQSG